MNHKMPMVAVVALVLLSASNAHSEGLVAYWDFDSPDVGGVVTDISGNALTGVLEGGAAITTGSLGYTGEAIDLIGNDAAQDRMTVSKDQFTPYNPDGNSFSVSFWVKGTVMGGFADHAGTNGYDITGGGSTADGNTVVSTVVGSGGSSSSGWEVPATTTVGLDADNTWEHVAFVVDRTNAEFWIYVDGEAETTYKFGWTSEAWKPNLIPETVVDIKLDQSDLKLGDKNEKTGFEGLLDDYAIYDVALTPNQVALLADGSKNPANLFASDPTGDADGDGDVDAADYIALKTHMGQKTGAVLPDGDFDGDTDVDWDDLQILIGDFGAASAGAGPSAVPEPASAMLLMFGAAALLRRRRGGSAVL